jgi:hypothetical protein
VRAPCSVAAELPDIILRAGTAAVFAAEEFFDATIQNDHTRRAYIHAVKQFLAWAEERQYRSATFRHIFDRLSLLIDPVGNGLSRPGTGPPAAAVMRPRYACGAPLSYHGWSVYAIHPSRRWTDACTHDC